ncbi:RNA-directed DNA polymerase, eukaryota [Tanacetum coccineum]
MNALSINVQGFGDLNKRRWVRDLCNIHKVNFLAIQETKMLQVDLWMLRQVALWPSLAILIAEWDGATIMMGDFNEVREAGERYGSIFKEKQDDIFNEY